MVRPIIFFVFVFVLLAIINLNSNEGFTNYLGIEWTTKNNGTPTNCNTQAVKVSKLGVGSIEASPAPASDLPSAPAGFRPKETPTPYTNPVLEPAKYIRILSVKEELQAFFGFQSQSLESKTDPSTQLPLTRARADLSDLINVQSVMERNPGLPSRITNKQLSDITSNLKYLRDMLNDLKVDRVVEGFKPARTITDPPRASLKDLESFRFKVIVELNRLGASGTTDSLTQGRINTLTTIKNEIDDIIVKIEKGIYTPKTIPIFKSDIKKSLPILGNTNKPLPKFLKNNSLPPAIASLFPGGLSPRDSEQGSQINNIVKGYMKNIFEGTSWDLDLKVKHKKPKNSARSRKSKSRSKNRKLGSKKSKSRSKNRKLGSKKSKSRSKNRKLGSRKSKSRSKKGRSRSKSRSKNRKLGSRKSKSRSKKGRSRSKSRSKNRKLGSKKSKSRSKKGRSRSKSRSKKGRSRSKSRSKKGRSRSKSRSKKGRSRSKSRSKKGRSRSKSRSKKGKSRSRSRSKRYRLSSKNSRSRSKKSRSPYNSRSKKHTIHRKPTGYNVVTGLHGLQGSKTSSVPGALISNSQYGIISNVNTNNGTTPGLPGTSNRIYPDAVPGGLDWEKRSRQIINQVKKRGLDPKQFGAMPFDVEVDQDFSWRGYTKMLCSRLNTVSDPGLAVTVGCPRDNWEGWRL